MALSFIDRLSRGFFAQVHGRNLVYNTCWEDPRCDREALELTADHNVLMITSAGCNALDYALDDPRHIYCIDVNPRQNALLELKIAAIRGLDHETFFRMFGEGQLRDIEAVYGKRIRPHLQDEARAFWDSHLRFFRPGRLLPSFYYHGTSGWFARLMTLYLKSRKAYATVGTLFEVESPAERRQIYLDHIRDRVWSGLLRKLIGYGPTLSLVGVPRSQQLQIAEHYNGGVAQFVEDALETVFTRLPTKDNYFWWIYLFGYYTEERCPEYLKPDAFARLKAGGVDRISTHTTTILDFLNQSEEPLHRFVLLDHMDWLSSYGQPTLAAEWQAIADRAAAGARMLWRSAALEVDFVDPIEVMVAGERQPVGTLLRYNRKLAERLHAQDRVHTYGSFHIADWLGAATPAS
ncbi:MAG: BtaA family protein [Pseudomonadota bacterium]